MTDQVVSTRIEWVREHCRLLRAISVPGHIDAAIATSYLDGKYPPAPR